MDEKQKIDKQARKTIQEVTGTPAEQLRGLTAQGALNDFIAQRLSSPQVRVSPAPSEVRSNTTTFPQHTVRTNEQPLSIPQLGGNGGIGLLTDIIIIFSGTAYYNDLSGNTTGPV